MKTQIPTPVVIGIVALVVLVGGFFLWKGMSGGAAYTAQEQAMDKETTKPTGQNLYGTPGATETPNPDANSEASRRGAGGN